MRTTLHTLHMELAKQGLHINISKSKIMKINFHHTSKYQWNIYNSLGIKLGSISESKAFKYLGVIFHQNGNFTEHTGDKLRRAKSRVEAMKMLAAQSFDRSRSAIALWRQSILQAALFGASIITHTKKWLLSLESLQHQVLKWIIRASRRASASALRGIFGCIAVQTEIEIRKITLWQRIARMGEDRLPRQCLAEMVASEQQYRWYTTIQDIRQRYNITTLQFADRIRWQAAIRSQMIKVAWQAWLQYVVQKQEFPPPHCKRPSTFAICQR